MICSPNSVYAMGFSRVYNTGVPCPLPGDFVTAHFCCYLQHLVKNKASRAGVVVGRARFHCKTQWF